MRLVQRNKFTQIINPGATVTATTTSAAYDTKDGVLSDFAIIVNIGAVATADATNYFTFKVQESDDNSTYKDIDSSFYVASNWDLKINATAEANAVQVFGIKSDKRYLKVVATETGTASAIFSVTIGQEAKTGQY